MTRKPTLVIPAGDCASEPLLLLMPTPTPPIIAPLLAALKEIDLTDADVQRAVFVEAAKGSNNGYVLENIETLATDLEIAIGLAEIAAAAEKRAASGFCQENLEPAITDLLWFLFRNTFDAFHRSSKEWRVVLNQTCADVLDFTVPGAKETTDDVRYCCLILQCGYPVILRNWDSDSDSDSD